MTLIDRLSKLDGPDREVDGEIWRYLLDGSPRPILHGPVPKLTASVDAAIALAERVLPDHDFIIGKTNGGLTIHAQVGPNGMEFGATPAIALCIALLRAKGANHGND